MPVVKCSFIDHIAWGSAPVAFGLSGSVHVWRLQLSANLHTAADLALLLTPDETERSKSYLQEYDRNRFILSRGTLRSMLSRYMNVTASDIQFAVGENNKPFIQSANATVHYNVSHAGDWVLIALSGAPIGIDIELLNTDLDYTEILPMCFSAAEISSIQNSSNSRKQFYQYWTRKEALVKATGKGVDNDLPFVPCLDGTHEAAAEKIGADSNWTTISFEMGNEYVCSAAYNAGAGSCLFFEAAHP